MGTASQSTTTANLGSVIHIRVLLIKYGKLLLVKQKKSTLWEPVAGQLAANENLPMAIAREVKQSCGWSVKNIRLFRINIYKEPTLSEGQSFELVFIVEGVEQTGQEPNRGFELRWFPLNALPSLPELDEDHAACIHELGELVHTGKTLDLDRLPPVFSLRKKQQGNLLELPLS